jgi:uncharacterized lipoprotein YmbA
MKTTLLILFASAALAIVTGCRILEPQPDRTEFYVLRPETAPPTTNPPTAAGPLLQIGPGNIAAYLAVTPLVIDAGAHRVKLLDLHHWAEPLPKGIARVLLANLEGRRRELQTFVYPEPAPAGGRWELRYQINRFEGTLDGPVTLDVNWTLVAHPSGRVLTNSHPVYTIPATNRSDSVAAYVARLSAALAQWSEEVAGALPPAQP